jgi:hypothetical protein
MRHTPAERNLVHLMPMVCFSWPHSSNILFSLKGLVSGDFGTLLLISLDRFEGRNRAGSAKGPEIHPRKEILPGITSLFTRIEAGNIKTRGKSFER